MTNYAFDNTIPAASHTPAVDQPNMLINNQSTQSIIGVDHVTFGSANGGSHLQTSFYSNQSPSIGSALGIMYPASGTANSASNLFLLNTVGTFPISLIKAMGSFTGTTSSGSISFLSQVNCASISSNGSGLYTITLATNATTGDNVVISVNSQSTSNPPTTLSTTPSYYFTGNVLKIFAGTTSRVVSFIVLQI